MNFIKSFVSILFLFIYISANAGQSVGGLEIDYPNQFNKDIATSKTWMSGLPDNVRRLVLSMEIFIAKPYNGLGEVTLVKVRYIPELNGSIDSAANESARRISLLQGIKKFQQQIIPVTVSDLPARQVSISANRWGGKLGGEFIIVYNRETNEMWQMQLLFGKKKSINPFASLKLDDKRNYAKSLLSTIKINK